MYISPILHLMFIFRFCKGCKAHGIKTPKNAKDALVKSMYKNQHMIFKGKVANFDEAQSKISPWTRLFMF